MLLTLNLMKLIYIQFHLSNICIHPFSLCHSAPVILPFCHFVILSLSLSVILPFSHSTFQSFYLSVTLPLSSCLSDFAFVISPLSFRLCHLAFLSFCLCLVAFVIFHVALPLSFCISVISPLFFRPCQSAFLTAF